MFFFHSDHRGPRLNVVYKFAWAWQAAFFDAALFITIVYWGALHPCKQNFTHHWILVLARIITSNNIWYQLKLFLFISVVVKSHLLKTTIAKVLNFFVHGFNSISILIDLFINARPHRIPHLMYSIVFGVLYMTFRWV